MNDFYKTLDFFGPFLSNEAMTGFPPWLLQFYSTVTMASSNFSSLVAVKLERKGHDQGTQW